MSSTPAEAALEHIRRLIAFDTTSRDSNLPLIEHVVLNELQLVGQPVQRAVQRFGIE